MFSLKWQLQTLHVLGNLFWIGAIVATGLLLVTKGPGSTRDRAALARQIYLKLAVPAFGVSFLAGTLRLLLDLSYYFTEKHFMHAKLPLAVGVVVIHHLVGARARRMESGAAADPGPVRILTWLLAVFAVLSAWLALTEPF